MPDIECVCLGSNDRRKRLIGTPSRLVEIAAIGVAQAMESRMLVQRNPLK